MTKQETASTKTCQPTCYCQCQQPMCGCLDLDAMFVPNRLPSPPSKSKPLFRGAKGRKGVEQHGDRRDV